VIGGDDNGEVENAMLFERETAPLPLSAKNVAGNSTFACVCIGNPAESKVDTREVRDEADASFMFANPAIEQTIGTVGDKGAAAADNCSSSDADCSVKYAVTVRFDEFRLEHEAADAEPSFNAENLRPVTEMDLRGADAKKAAAVKITLAVTLLAPAR
jgi:hypothetical protein